MSRTTFPMAHYLIATEGLALMRLWYLDDDQRAPRLMAEVAEICRNTRNGGPAQLIDVEEHPPSAGYTAWARSYDRDNLRNPLVPLEASALDTLLVPVTSGKALDAACGTGRQADRLLGLGYEVTGVDATPAMLEQARRNHPNVRYVKGDLRDLPFPDGEFDLVLSTLAVTHVAELDQVVAELSRVARTGGRIVLVDVHPLQVILGAHATVPDGGGGIIAVRNHIHLVSRYLTAFAVNGLHVERCLEPTFTDESVADLPAAAHIPEANRVAFVGTPALLAWSLHKPEEWVGKP